MLNNTHIDVGSQKIGISGSIREWVFVIGGIALAVIFFVNTGQSSAQVTKNTETLQVHEERLIRLEVNLLHALEAMNEMREDVKLIKKAVIK